MFANFSGVHAKLDRGDLHLRALERDIAEWGATEPFVMRQEVDSTTKIENSRYRVLMRLTRESRTTQWALMMGDAVHCWRSALDHAVYALAVHGTQQDPPPKERVLQFPICDRPTDPGGWTSKRYQTEGLPDVAQAFIESVQPYHGGHEHGLRPLALLRDLDDTDKHRVLQVVVHVPSGATAYVINGGAADVQFFDEQRISETETLFAVFTFSEPQGEEVKMVTTTRMAVSIEMPPGETPWVHWGVDDVLRTLGAEVRRVVSRLEAFGH